MRYVDVYQGLSPEDAQSVKRSGIDTKRLEALEKHFVVLATRGKVLHQAGCRAVDGKKTVPQKRNILDIGDEKKHSCCRYLWGWGTEMEYVRHAVWIAQVQDETEQLAASPTPAHDRLARLLEETSLPQFHEAVTSVDGESGRVDTLRKTLLNLKSEWASASVEERCLSFIAGSIAFPRSSLTHLGVPPSAAWRVVCDAWTAWQEALLHETPFLAARELVQTQVAAQAKKLGKNGEDVTPPHAEDIAKMVQVWEETAVAACAKHEGDVLVALHGIRSVHGTSAVQKVISTFPSAKSSEKHTAVVRCPAVIADWLHDNTKSWTNVTWLGEAQETDTQQVLETLAGVWSPGDGTELASPREALNAARSI